MKYLKAVYLKAILPLTVLLTLLVQSNHLLYAEKEIRFDRDIRPILSDKCIHCHGPDEKHREADLRLDTAEGAYRDHDGIVAIKPGSLEESEAWYLINSKDKDELMPPPKSNKTLTAEEKDLLKRWILQGAKYSKHWSFVKPAKVKSPKPTKTEQHKKWDHPIDRFILEKLDEAGLSPNKEADRRTLIRRLSLDLTGLPPAPKDVEAFVSDNAPNAYEKLVNKILASPHYGERMAQIWLDAARYGDTSVYHADGYRNMWAWRDWVVNAYNKNKPFDEFTIEQIAGDLIPNATIDQKLASGFNRNNGTTDEGGLIVEEYRVEYAVDRVATTSTVWLGLTMECAQCHDHKYDPFSMEDYYSFFAFFNISADSGKQTRRGNAAPMIDIPKEGNAPKITALEAKIAALKNQIKTHREKEEATFQNWSQTTSLKESGLAAPPTDALIAFKLNEGKGKEVRAVANPDKAYKINGQVKWVNAQKGGKGLAFNGKTHINLGDTASFDTKDTFTQAAWVNIGKKARGAVLAKMDDNNNHRGYDFYFANNKLSVHLSHMWPEDAIKVTTKKALKSGRRHILATYDGSGKAAGVNIYVDGKKQGLNIDYDTLKETIKTDAPLKIGSRTPGSPFFGTVEEVTLFKRALTQSEIEQLAKNDQIAPILAINHEKRSPKQINTLREHYFAKVDKAGQKFEKTLAAQNKELVELKKPLTTVMVMSDMGKPRKTFILARGAYDSPTDKEVKPDTPSALSQLTKDAPRNRMGLAKWLVSKDNPLTARVAVNRYWQMLFGTGLVNTPSDFGSQGAYPSHPELLDWLAVDFVEHDWDVKRMLKQIVMSQTYRQSSVTTKTHLKKDRTNRLLGRGARYRLTGEFIRDGALSVSGLLKPQLGGPGVKPYQPPGLWKEVGLSGKPIFKQDKGEKLYRRSIYTYWKRSAPAPSMVIFDAPTREKCTVERPRTNTPLQALVTLNDVQFVEAARHFAQRLLLDGGDNFESRLNHAYMLLLARAPKTTEIQVYHRVYQAALKKYLADKEAAKMLLSFGDSPRNELLNISEHAAWTILCNMLLNLDETFTRE